jgi:hypothetical protein
MTTGESPECTCQVVRAGNCDATGLNWKAACPVHGLGTDYYEAVLKPRFERRDRELAHKQQLLRERRRQLG